MNGPGHLSVSMIGTLEHCPRAWYNSYILRQRTPPTLPMIKGLGLDAAANAYWEAVKAGTGEGITWIAPVYDQRKFTDLAVEGLYAEATKHKLGVKARDVTDVAVAASAYHLAICQKGDLTPMGTQRKINLSVPGVTRPIIGYIDLLALDSVLVGLGVIDNKYTGNAHDILNRYGFQLGVYALAEDCQWAAIAYATPQGESALLTKEVTDDDRQQAIQRLIKAEAAINEIVYGGAVPECSCGYCINKAEFC